VIKILQSWSEIQVATQKIQHQGLPLHRDVHKNWDHALLYDVIYHQERDWGIIDLGCGDCCTLDFLAASGFRNLHGIDLQLKSNSENVAYTLYQGDLTKTPLVDNSIELAVSISVIEHGVELPAFFAEVSRLLKTDGLLLLTTDYWEQPRSIDTSIKPFGLEWKIFCAGEIGQLIDLAGANNLVLEEAQSIPACFEQPIAWYGYNYTFIALLFRKVIVPS
jgi:SAM-dependent methyltransferase